MSFGARNEGGYTQQRFFFKPPCLRMTIVRIPITNAAQLALSRAAEIASRMPDHIVRGCTEGTDIVFQCSNTERDALLFETWYLLYGQFARPLVQLLHSVSLALVELEKIAPHFRQEFAIRLFVVGFSPPNIRFVLLPPGSDPSTNLFAQLVAFVDRFRLERLEDPDGAGSPDSPSLEGNGLMQQLVATLANLDFNSLMAGEQHDSVLRLWNELRRALNDYVGSHPNIACCHLRCSHRVNPAKAVYCDCPEQQRHYWCLDCLADPTLRGERQRVMLSSASLQPPCLCHLNCDDHTTNLPQVCVHRLLRYWEFVEKYPDHDTAELMRRWQQSRCPPSGDLTEFAENPASEFRLTVLC